MSSEKHMAIIGAGLSGLALALALHQQNIKSVIYESRPASLDVGGAIMLSPNGLQVLDRLGVFARIESSSYKFDMLHFRSETDEALDQLEHGNAAKYGYSGVRIYRFELIKVLLQMVDEAGITVEYGKKFDKMVSETEAGVEWQFADGTRGSAPVLIGADGIHSRVRSYLCPGLQPKFTGMVGISAAVPTIQLKAAAGYPMPVTIMHPQRGAFVMAPQHADGSEVFIGKQYRFTGTEPDRAAWDALLADKAWCVEFLREGSDDFPAIVGNATSAIDPERVHLWPFYQLPTLETWSSTQGHGRVVIVGDAAHAIPPSAGQGINQGFEDIYALAGVFGRLGGVDAKGKSRAALKRWQAGRQERINGVLELNAQINARRLPGSDASQMKPFDLEWLYAVDFDGMIDGFAGDA